jgi:thiol-disulfide isomerase/thioredoxin
MKPTLKILLFISLVLIISCTNVKKNDASENTVEFTTWSEANILIINYDEFKPMIQVSDGKKLHVFNFWATWCKPCVEELPYFEKLNKKYDEIEVTLVSLDFPNKLSEQVIPFANNNKLISNIVLLDDTRSHFWIPDVDENWSGAIPATLMLSKKDRIFYEKAFTFEELEKEILNQLK